MPPRKGLEVIPSAKRLIGSLRDMGYEFAPAVADLVDNSIEAGATQVDVWIEFHGDSSWVRIADNGCGMASLTLREAMRYGAERDYADGDLGKFGLGLKTASLSQCRRLTVSSRPRGGMLSAYCWDLDHVEDTNRWEVLPVLKAELPQAVHDAFDASHQTVIFWEQLDRILGYRHPYGEAQRKQLAQMCREVEQHLAMVFHRFLSGELRRRRVRMTLNGNRIEPWDPFCRSEKRTRKLEARSLTVTEEDTSGEVLLEPFVLPHEKRFSSPEAHTAAKGPQKWNQQQGFYIYRADRLIQSGGWCGLRALDEHTKLARIALSFGTKLDEAFKINVAKMRVQLPLQIKQELERLLAPAINAANAEYRTGGSHSPDSGAAPNAKGPSKVSPSAVACAPSTSTSSDNGHQPHVVSEAPSNVQTPPTPVTALFTRSEVFSQLLAVAQPDEAPVIRAVFSRLGGV